MLTRIVLVLIFLAACGDNLDPPMVDQLPSCVELGCPMAITSTDRVCAATGVCACRVDRSGPATACAPSCGDLACAGISCGNLTPDGDVDPTACTCDLVGSYVGCVGD